MTAKGSPIVLIVCVLVMAGVCGGLFYLRQEKEPDTETSEVKVPAVEKETKPSLPTEEKKQDVSAVFNEEKSATEPEESKVVFSSPTELAQNLKHGLEKIETKEDLEKLLNDLGIEPLAETQLDQLYKKIGKFGAHLKPGNFIDEIGEIERKKHSRWALNFKDDSRVFFEMKRGDDNSWRIVNLDQVLDEENKLESILEEGNRGQLDGLLVAHSFVNFAIKQEFSKAKQLVDSSRMSDVKLAGLCIIFDEGGYKLRKPRGVLTSIKKPTRSGYNVYIDSDDGAVAQFSLLLDRPSPVDPWRVIELNFNTLLSEFIKSSGGDSYFTPFVKNPKGGDSIVVYFDFNVNMLSERTRRQLSIVANILKLDNTRKITLTGHTDAVGGSEYNIKLSTKRAEAVRDYLATQGVAREQIITKGYGSHRPREANTFADGSDNPEGRKANRRTEIYLDF